MSMYGIGSCLQPNRDDLYIVIFNYVWFLLNQSTFDTSIAVKAHNTLSSSHKVILCSRTTYTSDHHNIGRLTWDWYEESTWYHY